MIDSGNRLRAAVGALRLLECTAVRSTDPRRAAGAAHQNVPMSSGPAPHAIAGESAHNVRSASREWRPL